MVIHVEGWHPNLQPRSNRSRSLQEAEQPLRLNFGALAIEYRRRKGYLLRRIEATDVSSAILYDVASHAVAEVHVAPAHDDLFLSRAARCAITLLYLAFVQTGQENANVLDILILQIEVRHYLLDILGGIGP